MHKLLCCGRYRKAIYARGSLRMWFLGIDVGTGGTRAVVVDGAGKLIAGASRGAAGSKDLSFEPVVG